MSSKFSDTGTSDSASTKYSSMTESIIERCLHHFEYADAVTLAEVYYDQVKSDSASLLFARALQLNGNPLQAFEQIEKHGINTAETRYFFAKIAYDLKKILIAEKMLRASNNSTDLHPMFKGSDQEPFAHGLLATLMKEAGKYTQASRHYHKSIVILPVLWTNVKNFCDLGGKGINPALHGYDIVHDGKFLSPCSSDEIVCSTIEDQNQLDKKKESLKSLSRLTRRRAGRISQADAGGRYLTRNKAKTTTNKQRTGLRIPDKNKLLNEENKVNLMNLRRHGTPLSSVNNSGLTPIIISTNDESEPEQMDVENHMPRERKPLAEIEPESVPTDSCDYVYEEIFGYIVEMTGIQYHLSKYKFEDAMEALNRLSTGHASLPLSLELLGRVLFEKADFERSSTTFAEMHKRYPHRIDGLEVYSSCLWQLQHSTKLAALSKELTEKFRHRPETWCVTGNLYSLEKQCAVAVECFDKATRLTPKMGYPHCLLGNELIDVGHFERAVQAFHQALLLSPQDFRPNLGMGIIEQRQSKLNSALHHMRQAVSKNPSNIILQCHLAVVEQANGNENEAVEILNKAITIDPNNVAARFHKARILFDNKKLEEAKSELLKLKDMSPNESHIFFLLGRVYRKLGDQHRALMYFNYSSEIDPRGEQSRSVTTDQPYDDEEIDPEAIARMTRP